MQETKKERQNACQTCCRICKIRNESREIDVNWCSAFVSGVTRYEQTITQTRLAL